MSDRGFVSNNSLILEELEPRFCGDWTSIWMIQPFACSLKAETAPVTGGWAASINPGAGYETGHIGAPCVLRVIGSISARA
ncbi:hypothetical protein N7507_008467 [Penicillium longicatenatum]|nr:hypothetical protein N7507_008467 [Penicillium longicatenatum]